MKNNRTFSLKEEIRKRKKDGDWVRDISSNVIRRDKKETRNKRMLGASLVLFIGLSAYVDFWVQDLDLRNQDLLSIGIFEELENALDK
ncbi:hypothetical protein [Leptospira borgpetersenii]|uniref:Uncharacterized protein n=2 Tax=Leptospira borgpetersenii serovar Hardjo-bovis TaxID=338217 RepID=Q04UV6_LEPBJ|nr:hypothetical protein [Leptospira borgpetersenii]ABJ75314.1 Hypothetical protein LBJ_0637 [Leptospira borgpetersenii serovar Hardjo-bovis str. JB197]ABJ79824.1 Hypothetical protein LBL_2442 [Leptospira borgpetersenii serovar Hardjo-bovis str. L550]AMX59223.1 hypothetical protein LBK6_13040 [Leptospira borgpetersenii serovar Hardjo]AMX62452.1 hypothetical protein LBK9_12950 [Leptospira borgpetersenii serovar Hardjo]AMX65694.1 hypothetical protein LBK30_12965 [Leptospira borgpetersenii serovar